MLENADLGKLIIRLTLGGLMLFHGIAKLLNGIGFIEGELASHGLPTFLAYGVYVGEIIAPLMVILGYQTRIGALLIIFNMCLLVSFGQMDRLKFRLLFPIFLLVRFGDMDRLKGPT